MRRLAAAIVLAVALSVVGATPASAEVCKTWSTTYRFYEAGATWSWLSIAKVELYHKVCVTRTGYTYRWAGYDLSQSQGAGLVWSFHLNTIRPTWQTNYYDRWTVYGNYAFCVVHYGIRVCGPKGNFKIVHRVIKYNNSTTLAVMDNRVVRLAPSYSVDGLRWTKTSRSWTG